LLRILLLLLFFWSLNRLPKRLVVYGPQQAVETLNPKIGVHTRLTDEVEEWKIQRTLQMVREMGSPWVVEYFPWGYYEPAKGRYQWGHPDAVVNHASAQGLTVIARLDFVPEWARPPETTYRYLDRDHYADYGDFVYAFVSHFAGKVKYIVVWNEPNLAFEWGYRLPDPPAYAQLLCLAYRRAKEANPEVQVLAAGLAPTLAPPGSEWGMDDLVFLQRMLDAGAGACFDGLAIHAYGLTLPPTIPPTPERSTLPAPNCCTTSWCATAWATSPVSSPRGAGTITRAGPRPCAPTSAWSTPCAPMRRPSGNGIGAGRCACGPFVIRGPNRPIRITMPS
jgi:hypothetical protein